MPGINEHSESRFGHSKMLKPVSSKHSRRTFLQDTTQSLAAISVSSALSGCAQTALQNQQNVSGASESRKLGWAIVGLGSYATNQIMPSFAKSEHSRLVALVSGSPDKARQLADQYGLSERNIYDYRNFDSIKNNPDVDIVYVILPNSMHHEFTIRAARAGKHVVTEKPMAVSVRECEEMIAECRKANRKLMVGYRSRFEPHNVEAIRMTRERAAGDTKVIIVDHGFNTGDPNQWRLKKALAGGGSLMDIGIYSLNAARYLTGEEPVEVNAFAHSTPNDPRFREVEETINFQLRFPSGVLANCTSSYGYNAQSHYRVVGTRGWFELEPATSYSGQRMRVKIGDRVEERQLPPPAKDQFTAQLDHMSECVMQNNTPLVAGEEGLQDVRAMMAIYEAARTGKTVKVSG